MKLQRLFSIIPLFVFALFVGCVSKPSDSKILYGRLPVKELEHAVKQFESLGILYEVRNGNEVYLTEREAERFRTSMQGGLGGMPISVRNTEAKDVEK